VDIAPGGGPRCIDGAITVDDTSGHGVIPDEAVLGSPVAVFT